MVVVFIGTREMILQPNQKNYVIPMSSFTVLPSKATSILFYYSPDVTLKTFLLLVKQPFVVSPYQLKPIRLAEK